MLISESYCIFFFCFSFFTFILFLPQYYTDCFLYFLPLFSSCFFFHFLFLIYLFFYFHFLFFIFYFLGFLNPALYLFADSFKLSQSATPSPIFPEPLSSKSFYRDVTYGGNHCLKDPFFLFCCEQGFEASRGWDPVTGKYVNCVPLLVRVPMYFSFLNLVYLFIFQFIYLFSNELFYLFFILQFLYNTLKT